MRQVAVPVLISFLFGPWALGSPSGTGFEEEIKAAKAEVAALKKKREVLDQVESARKLLDDLLTEEESLVDEFEKVGSEYEALEEERIRAEVAADREKAVGESVATIRTKDGKVFENCTIRKVSDVGMTIRHSRGSSRIAAEDLPDEFQARFSFDAERAIAQLKAERRMMILTESMYQEPEAGLSEAPRYKRIDTGFRRPGASEGFPSLGGGDGSEPRGWLSTHVLETRKHLVTRELIKHVEFRARANCPAKLVIRRTVNRPFVVAYPISEGQSFIVTIWMHDVHSVRLYAESGELLGEETSTR